MSLDLGEIRRKVGITQDQLAEVMHVYPKTLSRFETKRSTGVEQRLGRYLKALGCRSVIKITLPTGEVLTRTFE